MLIDEKVTDEILGAAIDVHKALGPGLLEPAYEACLSHELVLRGVPHRRQVALPLLYKGEQLECGYRLDLLVRESVVVEVKATDQIAPVHEAQLMTYLRLTGLRVGLIINFNVVVLRHGVVRRVI